MGTTKQSEGFGSAATEGNSDDKAKDPLELVVDRSKAQLDVTHFAAMYLWLGWFNFYGTLMIIAPLMWLSPSLWSWGKYPFLAVMGLLLLSAVAPVDRKKQPLWGKVLGKWLMRKASEYFRIRIFCEAGARATLNDRASAPCLYLMEPHDILPVSIFALSKYLSFITTNDAMGCLSSICFHIPGMRHVYTWGHATDVNKKTICRHLSQGTSLALCPGGAQEVTYMSTHRSKEIVIYLKKRMGIVKIAAQFGVPLVPTFTFNQRAAFDFYIPRAGFLHKLGRKIGFIPLYYSGWLGIPYGQPKPVPLTLVVGSPIMVPKMAASELIEANLLPYQTLLIDAMRRIYEENKERFDMADVELRIL